MTRVRVSGLEVLRGYAALAVIVYHVHQQHFKERFSTTVLTYAVALFFALSAYSLLYGYSQRLFDERSMLRFYVRRVFRICPLFYAALAGWLIYRYIEDLPISKAEIALNLTFLFPLLPGYSSSLVPAGWSLGVEWFFYFAFPLFALLSRSVVASAVAFIGCILLSQAFVVLPWIYGNDYIHYGLIRSLRGDYVHFSILRNLMFFQAGVFAFALMQHIDLKVIQPHVTWILIGSVALSVAIYEHVDPYVYFALLFCLWLVCAHAGLPSLLDNRFSRFAGRISYGIYLLHLFAMVALERSGVYAALKHQGHTTGLVISIALTITITILLAEIAYRVIEVKCIALGERLLGSVSVPGRATSVVKDPW